MASSTSHVRSARCSGWPEDIQRSTRFWAETTVLWLRRPKKWPISLKAARVCLRASHMASIRGWLTRVDLSSACKLAGSRPKTSQTAFSMSPSRTTRLLWWIISASASSANVRVIGRRKRLARRPQTAKRAGKLPGVVREFCGDVFPGVLRDLQLHPPRQLPDDSQPRGVVGRIDAADHAAGQPRRQFRPQFGQFDRRTVGGEHQLPMFAHQRVDRVQQFDLRRPFADHELQIVENQQAHAAVLAAETRQAAAAQRLEKMAGELFGREIDRGHVAGALSECRPDAFEEVRFAHAGRAVDQQRRDLARLPDDHLGRGQRQLVRRPRHERIQRGELSAAGGVGIRTVARLGRLVRGNRRYPQRRPFRREGGLRGAAGLMQGGLGHGIFISRVRNYFLLAANVFSSRRIYMVAGAIGRQVRRIIFRASRAGFAADDVEIDGRAAAQNVFARLGDLAAEISSNPIQETLIGHADSQGLAVERQMRTRAEPQIVSFFLDLAGQRILQSRHDLPIVLGHFFLPCPSAHTLTPARSMIFARSRKLEWIFGDYCASSRGECREAFHLVTHTRITRF